MRARYTMVYWARLTCVFLCLVDISNEFYHACIFYFYLLFSSKYRLTVKKLLRCSGTVPTNTNTTTAGGYTTQI